jgi:adenosylcobinamide-phosphate synthase
MSVGVVAGWAADLMVGDPRRGHPVALFGAVAGRVERRLWRNSRAAGVAYVGLLVGVPTAAAYALGRLLPPRGRTVLLAAAVWASTGGRSLGREATGIADAVERGDLADARRRLPALVGRDPAQLDGPELCRAATESVAENTSDAVVAPLLYGAVAGPAGVVAYRCANTLDAMVGHRSQHYERFGWAAARLDDVLNCVPARLTVLMAALLSRRPGAVLRTVRRDGASHPSPNAGRVEAAFAGALGVRLGGANHYAGRVEVRGPHGDGPAPGPRDVRRAVALSARVGAVTAAALGGRP